MDTIPEKRKYSIVPGTYPLENCGNIPKDLLHRFRGGLLTNFY